MLENERSGKLLPATILIPNDPDIREVFAEVLVGSMHLLEMEPVPCEWCGRDICACLPRPKDPEVKTKCPECDLSWRECNCICTTCHEPRHHGCLCPRKSTGEPLDVQVTSEGSVVHVSVDGQVVAVYVIDAIRKRLVAAGLPEVYLEQVAATMQTQIKTDPTAFLQWLKEGGQ